MSTHQLRYLGLASIAASLLAVQGSASAQHVATLAPISVVADGQEDIEATGGVVVSHDDIQRMQPRTQADLFSRESAIMVIGGAGVAQRIHVHGLEESKLAITVDGARQPGAIWHHAGSSVIDPAFLKRVEVETGAAAADAGFAAAAGALRYETVDASDLLDPGRTLGARIASSWGSNGQGWRNNAAGYMRLDAVDALVMVNRHTGHDYKDGNGNVANGTRPDLTSGLAKLSVENEGGHRLTVSAERSRDRADRLVRMNMAVANGTEDMAPFDIQRSTGTLRYTTSKPSDRWDPEAVLWYNDMRIERPRLFSTRPSGDFNSKSSGFGGKVQNVFTLPLGTITAGVDFQNLESEIDRYGWSNPQVRVPAGRLDERSRQAGVYTQARLEFDNGIDLSAGLRADTQRFDAMDGQRFDHSGISANATVSYALNDHIEVYGAAARTWLGVEQGEVGYYHARDYAYDPDLKPAWAMNYKVGLNFGVDSWQGGIGFFDTTIHDGADFLVITPAQGYRTNAGKLRSRGIDLSLAYLWSTGRAGARLSHADVTYDGSTVQPGSREAAPVGTTASFFVDQRVPAWHAAFGATVSVVRKMDDDDLIASGFAPEPGYAVVDAYASWNPQGNQDLTLRLDVNNLFDKAYFLRTNYPTTANGSVVAMPAQGRTVALGVSYRF